MSQLSSEDLALLDHVSELAYCNPFVSERVQLEQKILGGHKQAQGDVWNYVASNEDQIWTNAEAITRKVVPLAERCRQALIKGDGFPASHQHLYEDLILYVLFDRYRGHLNKLLIQFSEGDQQACSESWDQFVGDVEYYRISPEVKFEILEHPRHLWACFFQIRRVFHHVFFWIIGGSAASARLRSTIWQSVLTHNIRRYVKSLHGYLDDIPTLVTGPSGSGKELVAKAIAMSQYIPFDEGSKRFVQDYSHSFLAVNLAAMSPTLIESELFGHCKGAFTGAGEDRKGLFESCLKHGAVFLDEVGELKESIQVKLLRVLQTRSFQRLEELTPRQFQGKLIAATNRDFSLELDEGRFRHDLYYRLCADIIQTPTLAQQLADSYDDLKFLVDHLSRRIAGPDFKPLAEEACAWIEKNLGCHYPWPGNVRELEQCLRNLLIRGVYCPVNRTTSSKQQQFASSVISGELTADQLLERYCTLVYAQTGSYEEAARRLDIDRRTVKRKVNQDLLEELRTP
ncbi:MAG: sigma 54-interacting transcriptional regulator [Planctomycetota bacterium]